MATLFRDRLARLLIATLFACSALALGGSPASAQEKGGSPAAPQASQTLSGSPLQVVVQDDLAMEVYYEGAQQFYFGDAGGTFIIVDGVVYGTSPPAGGALTPIVPTLVANGPATGSGTAADPFRVLTTVAAGTTGIRVTQATTYVNGELSYDIAFNIVNTGTVARSVRIIHGADLYLNFAGNSPDYGYGFYDPATGAVGAASTPELDATTSIQVFIPGTPPTAYQEAFYADFWSLIGADSIAGPGLGNTIDPSYHDAAAGLQWDRSIAPGAQDTITMTGAFGLGEVILPPVEPDEEARSAAELSVAQRLSPNHAVARGSIITHEIVVVNHGQGRSDDATLTLPFDPALVRVLDARFSSEAGWVSELNADSLRIRTGAIPGDGGRLVATLRFLVLPTAPVGASLSKRIDVTWRDGVGGGGGISNLPIVVVGAADDNRPTYTLSVTPPAGPAGSVHQIDGFIFVPNEPVGVWYNTPGGEVVALDTFYADEAGNLFLDLSTDDTPAGAYSLVMYGLWSEFTAVGPFTIE